MPADAKRKDARKRKFGAQITATEPETTFTAMPELDNAELAGLPERSKALQWSQKGSDNVMLFDRNKDQLPQKAQRFIVFIGNLPYTATDASVQNHFIKVHPKAIRHRTDRVTGKSKGFAFLEFEDYDRMKTCLKLYHQSIFDDKETPARKLNVELTAGGGGGKSRDRKTKLRIKNERLNEQRKRRIQEEKQNTKIKKAKAFESTQYPAENGHIHPSRRSRLAAAGTHDT